MGQSCKKAAYGRWTQRQATKKEFINTAQECSGGVRKVHVQVGLSLAKKTEDEKSFHHYVGSKRLSNSLLLNRGGDLVTADTGKTDAQCFLFLILHLKGLPGPPCLMEQLGELLERD